MPSSHVVKAASEFTQLYIGVERVILVILAAADFSTTPRKLWGHVLDVVLHLTGVLFLYLDRRVVRANDDSALREYTDEKGRTCSHPDHLLAFYGTRETTPADLDLKSDWFNRFRQLETTPNSLGSLSLLAKEAVESIAKPSLVQPHTPMAPFVRRYGSLLLFALLSRMPHLMPKEGWGKNVKDEVLVYISKSLFNKKPCTLFTPHLMTAHPWAQATLDRTVSLYHESFKKLEFSSHELKWDAQYDIYGPQRVSPQKLHLPYMLSCVFFVEYVNFWSTDHSALFPTTETGDHPWMVSTLVKEHGSKTKAHALAMSGKKWEALKEVRKSSCFEIKAAPVPNPDANAITTDMITEALDTLLYAYSANKNKNKRRKVSSGEPLEEADVSKKAPQKNRKAARASSPTPPPASPPPSPPPPSSSSESKQGKSRKNKRKADVAELETVLPAVVKNNSESAARTQEAINEKVESERESWSMPGNEHAKSIVAALANQMLRSPAAIEEAADFRRAFLDGMMPYIAFYLTFAASRSLSPETIGRKPNSSKAPKPRKAAEVAARRSSSSSSSSASSSQKQSLLMGITQSDKKWTGALFQSKIVRKTRLDAVHLRKALQMYLKASDLDGDSRLTDPLYRSISSFNFPVIISIEEQEQKVFYANVPQDGRFSPALFHENQGSGVSKAVTDALVRAKRPANPARKFLAPGRVFEQVDEKDGVSSILGGASRNSDYMALIFGLLSAYSEKDAPLRLIPISAPEFEAGAHDIEYIKKEFVLHANWTGPLSGCRLFVRRGSVPPTDFELSLVDRQMREPFISAERMFESLLLLLSITDCLEHAHWHLHWAIYDLFKMKSGSDISIRRSNILSKQYRLLFEREAARLRESHLREAKSNAWLEKFGQRVAASLGLRVSYSMIRQAAPREITEEECYSYSLAILFQGRCTLFCFDDSARKNSFSFEEAKFQKKKLLNETRLYLASRAITQILYSNLHSETEQTREEEAKIRSVSQMALALQETRDIAWNSTVDLLLNLKSAHRARLQGIPEISDYLKALTPEWLCETRAELSHFPVSNSGSASSDSKEAVAETLVYQRLLEVTSPKGLNSEHVRTVAREVYHALIASYRCDDGVEASRAKENVGDDEYFSVLTRESLSRFSR